MKLNELLLYIETQYGCRVSVEPLHELFLSSERLAIPATLTIHNHEYCRFIKSLDGNHACAVHKHRTLWLARHGRCFCGCCPYGVWEYVQPVIFQEKLATVIYLGTYIKPDHPGWKHYSSDYSGLQLPMLTQEKKVVFPTVAQFLAEFLKCELALASDEAHLNTKQHDRHYYCALVQNLLALRYQDDLRLSDAAEVCGLNTNYLGNLLKEHLGKTFTQLLTEQRLAEAVACLKYRNDLSIAGVAKACGFRDSNYFSLVFSKKLGMSPTQFRANWSEAEKQNWKNEPTT